MKQKIFFEKLKSVNELINSAPVDNFEMVLEIAALICRSFYEAKNTLLFLRDNEKAKNPFVIASQSFSAEEMANFNSFEPLPIFDDILKKEQLEILNYKDEKKEAFYLGTTTIFAPLIANGVPFGIILINDPNDKIIKEEAKDLYELIVPVLSALIYNAILFKKNNETLVQLYKKNRELVTTKNEIGMLTMSIVSALEDASLFRDEETGLHILRVRKYSELIATEIGLDSEMVEKIELYSGLHDIGKLAIKYELLNKPGIITPEEFEEMKIHTIMGYNIINQKGIDLVATNIVLFHHERWDGTGYPHGISGNNIPIESRIVAIADVYDALSTQRVYKEKYSDEKSKSIIRNERGKQFDPAIVDVFLKHFDIIKELHRPLTNFSKTVI